MPKARKSSNARRDAINTLTAGGYHFRHPLKSYSTDYLRSKASAMKAGRIKRHTVRRAPRGSRRIARVGKGRVRLEGRGFANLAWHAQERASFEAIRSYCESVAIGERHGFYTRLEHNTAHPDYPEWAWRTVSDLMGLPALHNRYRTATSLPVRPFGEILRYGLHWKIRG